MSYPYDDQQDDSQQQPAAPTFPGPPGARPYRAPKASATPGMTFPASPKPPIQPIQSYQTPGQDAAPTTPQYQVPSTPAPAGPLYSKPPAAPTPPPVSMPVPQAAPVPQQFQQPVAGPPPLPVAPQQSKAGTIHPDDLVPQHVRYQEAEPQIPGLEAFDATRPESAAKMPVASTATAAAAGAGGPAATPKPYSVGENGAVKFDPSQPTSALMSAYKEGRTPEKIASALGVRKDGTIKPELFTGGMDTEKKMLHAFSPEQRKLWMQAQKDHALAGRKFLWVLSRMRGKTVGAGAT